jgi:hypothetical protein
VRREESFVSREARGEVREDAYEAVGKSAARVRVERALGGAFDYRGLVARALTSAEDVVEKMETRATSGDEAWRAFPNDETRAFAIDARRDIERRMRDIKDEIMDEIWGDARRGRRRAMAHEREREEKARAPLRSRVGVRKTAVAFGTTVRA